MFSCCVSIVSEVYGASLYGKFVFVFFHYLFIPYSVVNDHIRCFIKLGKTSRILLLNLCVNKLWELRFLIVDASKYYVERFTSLALCKSANSGWFNNCHFCQKRSPDKFFCTKKKIASNSNSYKISQHQVHVIRNTELDQALIFLWKMFSAKEKNCS